VSIIRIFIRLPFILWFLVAGGMGYMDYTSWETETFTPLLGQLEAKKGEVLAKQKELTRAQEFTTKREEKLKELQDLTLRLEATKSALPRTSSIPNLLKDLADVSDKVGLQFSRFRPEKERAKKFLLETPIAVDLKGTYVQVMSFLDGAANIERIIATEKLDLTNPQIRGPAAVVTATATLITYHLDEAAVAASVANPPAGGTQPAGR
jgi:type IV pilus assembly protein PilO